MSILSLCGSNRRRGRGGFLVLFLLPLLAVLFADSAKASVIFSEDFSGATPGANSNLAGTQFQVTSGDVDIVGQLNGTFFSCINNPSGNCIDMVGSPGAGAIESVPTFNLTAGDTYTITFGYILQGFDTGNTPTSDFTVGLGSFSDMLTAIPMVQNASLTYTPNSDESTVTLTFATDTDPDDYHGAVLDHVVVTETPASEVAPEPPAFLLVGTALGALSLFQKRKVGQL